MTRFPVNDITTISFRGPLSKNVPNFTGINLNITRQFIYYENYIKIFPDFCEANWDKMNTTVFLIDLKKNVYFVKI